MPTRSVKGCHGLRKKLPHPWVHLFAGYWESSLNWAIVYNEVRGKGFEKYGYGYGYGYTEEEDERWWKRIF